THYARAFDWRNYEYSKKPFAFNNDEEGFKAFSSWMNEIAEKHDKDTVIPGMEPTGHYWLNLGAYLQEQGMKPVHVNPHHVKKSKELDDNNPNKNDRKDPKTIAALVNEGRFSYPYIPTGIYAEIRSLSNLRIQTQEEISRIKNRIARWFSIYFPEMKDVYKKPDAKSGMMVIKKAPLPADIKALGVDGVNQIWRDAKLKGAGLKRAKTLVEVAERSIGNTEAPGSARIEIRMLLADYEVYSKRMDDLMTEIEKKLSEIPYIDKLLEINGVGIKTVSCFVAEVGDISRFDNPKQLQKLAGYAIVSNDSGKHNGESRISHRGRKRLRYALYEAAISVIGKNPEFKSIHEYYLTRAKNPLKKMQSVIA
ncbi:MAG: IS110 family transposase, partial [Lachnospiraceae bacterium]|nr:IS110 family transposase [Lachnospiraceae bacterium]